MSQVSDLAKSLWAHILSTVTVDDAVTVINAVTTGVEETATGVAPSVLSSIANRAPDALALIRDAVKTAAIFIGGPLAGAGAEIAIDLMADGHSMTPEEERIWMDRQAPQG